MGRATLCLASPCIPWSPAVTRPPRLCQKSLLPLRASRRCAADGRGEANMQAVAGAIIKRRWSWNLFAWCALLTALMTTGPTLPTLFSACSGLFQLDVWMGKSTEVERGSMAHFALRGATLGIGMSILFSLILLGLIAMFSPQLAFFLRNSGAVAGIEEPAKFLALIWLSWSTVLPWCAKEPSARLWPNTPHRLMLAGFSLGVGFMVRENYAYTDVVFPMLDGDLQVAMLFESEELLNSVVSTFLEYLLFRMLLNPHPYLTGIVAGRFAACTARRLTGKALWAALWPSMALHVLYNLAGSQKLRAVVHLICILIFRNTWNRWRRDRREGSRPNKSCEPP